MNTTLINNYSATKPYTMITLNAVSNDIVEVIVYDDNVVVTRSFLGRRESQQFVRECRRQGLKFK